MGQIIGSGRVEMGFITQPQEGQAGCSEGVKLERPGNSQGGKGDAYDAHAFN